MRRFYKFVSVLLSFLFVFQINYSGISVALAASDNSFIETTQSLTDEYVPTDDESYTELTDKREESTKYFLLESKRYEAVMYAEPVHYLQDGRYVDINNSLLQQRGTDGKLYYTNKANSFQAYFSTVIDGGWAAGISKDGYEMKWRLEGVSKGASALESTALTTNQWNALSEGEQRRNLPNISSRAFYKNVMPNVDLEYQLVSDKIKENITVSSYTGVNTIKQRISLVGLDLILKDDGTIVAVDSKDKSKVVFYLLAPYAFDSSTDGMHVDLKVDLTAVNTIQDESSSIVTPGAEPTETPSQSIEPTETPNVTETEVSESASLLSETDAAETPDVIDLESETPNLESETSTEIPTVEPEADISEESALIAGATNTYILTYTLDPTWLKSAKYPITIDPTVTTSLNDADILDTRINEANPTTNYQSSYISCTGYGSTSKTNYSLVQFNNMPTIGSSYMVQHAGYRVKKAASSTVTSYVSVHEITSSWNVNTVTWNTQPTFDPKVEDFKFVGLPANDTYEWDITRIAKKWYSGGARNGLLLKDMSPTSNYKEWYTSNAVYGNVPYCYFVYTNFAGMEGYWDYTTASLDRSGSANVSLYNGNLVYSHADVSTTGNRMPVSISHIFNSTNKDDNDTKMLYGAGWRTNYDQRVTNVTIGGISYYKYIDEDGTEHYFSLQNNVWQDESGLDFDLVINSNVPTVTDKKDNKLVFYATNDATKPGFLNYIEDRNGNRQTVGYDANGRINQITDGAGRIIRLTRDANNYLYQIREEVSSGTYRDTTFTYSGNKLTRITYSDGKYTTFTYDANGNLDYVTGVDGKKLDLSYLSASPYRVTYIGESTTTEQGSALSFAYGYNRTDITDVKGRKTVYQFNDYGNTVCVIGPDGSAAYSKFGTTPTGGDMSKITSTSRLQKFGKNYLKNSNMELTSDWAFGNNDSTATYTFSTDQKYSGTKSIKIVKGQAGANQTYATQTLSMTKGKTYTFSSYVKTQNVAGAYGAFLCAMYYDAQGVRHYDWSQVKTGTTDWERVSVTFTLPSNATSGEVELTAQLFNSSGTTWFDCMQLEEGSVVNRYNIIDNADFDYVTSGVPNKWTRGSNCGTSDIIVTSTDNGNPTYMSDGRFEFIGAPDKNKYIEQTLYLSGNEGDCYVAGGWAKGQSIPIADTTKYGLAVWFDYTDTAFTDEWIILPFSQDSNTWQYMCGAVVAKHAYQNMKIRVEINYNANAVDFDAIELFKEEFGSSFTYDANGNLTKATDAGKQNEQFQYTNDDLTKYIDQQGREFTYTYDSRHNMLTATSAEGLVYTYTYDNYGNTNSSKVGNTTDYIKATVNYDSNGNFTDYSTDPFGNQVDYTYNTFKGTLTSVTDPLGNTLNNTYDSNTNALTGTSMTSGTTTVSNSYTYINYRLTGISHNTSNGSVDYTISYDTLGRNTGTSVGSQALVTNSLEAQTGRLNSVTYGNGQVINYAYDPYDRVIKVSQGTTDLYSYEYDNSGNVGYMKDYVQNVEYRYEYDSLDRLGKITKTDSSGTSTSQYTFTSTNDLSVFKEIVGGTTYQTSYTYDRDGRPDVATFGTFSKDITYNPTLGVSSGYVLKNGANTIYSTSYAYDNGDGTTSTRSGRIASVTNGGETLLYTYDDRNYVTRIEKDVSNYSEYRYDAFGQLVRENYHWGSTSYTMIYSYDVGANITEKNKYDFVAGDGQVGTAIDTIAYTYDATWQDKLASYDGNAITYDSIGNPLNDGTWQYTWTQGNNLQQITNGTTTASYKYNVDGIRTEKTVNGTATKFNIVGGNITWQKTGANAPIYFIYDSGGKLWGLKYTDGNTYFYVRNAQNDIIKIVDSNGTVVVEYAYDAWGNPMSVTGSMASTLGVDNPFRYRGYYYDEETGLYYLNQRYYNPEWSRFVNADDVLGETGTLLTHNSYAYCANNPIMYADESGNFLNVLFGAVIGGVIGLVSNGLQNLAAGNNFFDNCESAIIGGVVSGAVAGATGGMSLLASGAISSAAGAIAEEAVSYIKGAKNGGKDLTWENIGKSALNVGINTVVGTATAGLGGAYSRLKFTPIKAPQYRMQVKYNIRVNRMTSAASIAIGNGLQAGLNTVYRVFKPRTAHAAYSKWL